MTSISSITTITPHPLPSLPPSPTTEEDLSRAHAWADEDGSDHSTSNIAGRKRKGKAKEVDHTYSNSNEDSDEAWESAAEDFPADEEPDAAAADDPAETRKVEENLRRWELAERQRRKAARDAISTPTAPSLVADVTRRASLLWPVRNTPYPMRTDLGNHTAVRSRESIDGVPLQDMQDLEAKPSPSPSPSPSRSSLDDATLQDPFANPPSPFEDSQQQDTPLMDPSSEPHTPAARPTGEEHQLGSQRPVLVASSSFSRQPPPPKPLGLPRPRTPPPRPETPSSNRPPQPTSLPTVQSSSNNTDDDLKDTRWWHDWLCGCGEGPDRGGHNQAGRTNPFE